MPSNRQTSRHRTRYRGQAIKRGYDAVPSIDDVTAKRNMLDQLDRMQRELIKLFSKPPVKVDHGHIVRDEESGQPVLDYSLVIAAITAANGLVGQIAKLRGVYAPTASRQDVFTHDAFAEAMQQLTSEIEELEKQKGQ